MKHLLVYFKERGKAIPNELNPSYNAGYEQGKDGYYFTNEVEGNEYVPDFEVIEQCKSVREFDLDELIKLHSNLTAYLVLNKFIKPSDTALIQTKELKQHLEDLIEYLGEDWENDPVVEEKVAYLTELNKHI